MSFWPEAERQRNEAASPDEAAYNPPAWSGLSACVEEAKDGPAVDPASSATPEAGPEAALDQSPSTPAPVHRRAAPVLIGVALVLSTALHAAVLVLFLDRPNRAGVEAELDAISVEIVLEAPAQEAVAAAGSAAPAPAEEIDPEPVDGTEAPVEQSAAVETPEEPAEPLEAPGVVTGTAEAQSPSEVELAVPRADIKPEAAKTEAQSPAMTIPEPPQLAETTADLMAVPEPRLKDDLTPAPTPNPAPSEPDFAEAVTPVVNAPLPSPRPADKPAPKAKPKPKKKPAIRDVETAKAEPTRSKAGKQDPAKAARTGKAEPGGRAKASAAGLASVHGGASAGSQAKYGQKLLSHVQRHKRYPRAAERQKITGSTKLAITIDRSGRLSGARIAGSSGHAILDEEAVAVARRAAPYPRPPDGVGGNTISFSVTLRFTR